jgi:hypothetical protein
VLSAERNDSCREVIVHIWRGAGGSNLTPATHAIAMRVLTNP